MVRVKETSKTSENVLTRRRLTARPTSVGTRRPLSRSTYLRPVMLVTMVAYVLGLPMFSSSRDLTSEASV